MINDAELTEARAWAATFEPYPVKAGFLTLLDEIDRLRSVIRSVLVCMEAGAISEVGIEQDLRGALHGDAADDSQPEPIPDLIDGGPDGPICPHCGGQPDSRLRTPDVASWYWRCDHCRITWTPDGTGGTQT